jgi:group I intron endonuclease
MPIVYQHKNKITQEVFYVGIGKTDSRAYSKDNRGKFWSDYTSKYEYEVEITHRDIIWEEACAIEKYLIAFWGRRDLGLGMLVNQTDGGDGVIGYKFTKEVIEKMSEKQKGQNNGFYNKKHNQTTIELFKTQKSGANHPMWGKKQSEETKKKRSLAMKGRPAKNKKRVKHIKDGLEFESTHELQRYYSIGTGAFYSRLNKGEIIYL